MKKIIFFSAFLLANLYSFNSYGQYVLETAPPYCAGDTVKISIQFQYLDDFFSDCEVNGQGYPVYVEYTVSGGTAFPSKVGKVQPYGLATNRHCSFIIFPTDWFNETDMILEVKGYYSIDGGNSFIPWCAAEQSILIHTKRQFPDIIGPDNIIDATPVDYYVSSLIGANTSYQFEWSVPSLWEVNSISGSSGNFINVSADQDGLIEVTTLPEVVACDYPAIKSVEVSYCSLAGGSTNQVFCESNSWTPMLGTDEFGSQMKWPRMTGDFNGDGRLDIIGFANQEVSVGLSTGASFSHSSWSTGFTYGTDGWRQDNYPRKIGDFDGDGKDDIIGFGHSQTTVGISTGTSFNTSLFSPYNALSYSDGYSDRNLVQRLIGDFTGDGKDDIVAFGYNEHDVAVSTGTSFDANLWSGNSDYSANSGWDDFNRYTKLVGDFNGDGKDDIVGFHNNDTYVGTSNGSSFVSWSWTSGFSASLGYEQRKHPRMVGDFNGDGMDDIIGFGHTDISVGISDGASFNVTNWEIDKSHPFYTTNGGWQVDAREIGVVSEADYGDAFAFNNQVVIMYDMDEIIIVDYNGDGMDDIVGFNNNGVHIMYSDGESFQCYQYKLEFGNEHGFIPPAYIRTAGNFDNSDDEAELLLFGETDTYVMNCDYCGDSHADAVFEDYYAVHQESGYQGWTVDIHEFCDNNVILDVSGSDCENDYKVEIFEFVLGTWTSTSVYTTNWTGLKAPDFIDLGALYTFEPNKLYMVSFTVGPDLSAINLWMELAMPNAELSLEPDDSYVGITRFNGLYTVNEYCNSQFLLSINMQGSGCYNKYRFEMIEVASSTLNPIGSPIQQVPSGGGWTNGNSMPANIPMPINNMVSGKLYRIQLFTENANGIDIATKYVKLKTCEFESKYGQIEGVVTTVVYPNPTGDNFINVQLADYGESGAIATLYNMAGQVLLSTQVNSNSVNKVELGNLAKGAYTIRITSDIKLETVRFVKN